jgi:hypothetical protein
MNKRSTSSSTSVGWIDVVAILAVVGILAFALGEIATGRIRDLSFGVKDAPPESSEVRVADPSGGASS